MKGLGEEFSATVNLGEADRWKSKVDPIEDCWAAKMLPSGVTCGDPTTPKVVKEDPCDPLVGWDGPKFVKPGGWEGFTCLLFWPKMVKAWLASPPKPTSWPLCLCWPKVVKAWLRCKLVPNEVKEPVVEGCLCLHGNMIYIILSWSPLDNSFFETHCIFAQIVQSFTPPHVYCYCSWYDKIFFHLLPRPLRLTSVSGATPSSSLTNPSSFAGFCTWAVCGRICIIGVCTQELWFQIQGGLHFELLSVFNRKIVCGGQEWNSFFSYKCFFCILALFSLQIFLSKEKIIFTANLFEKRLG